MSALHILCLAVTAVMLNGCAFFNLEMIQPTQPLREKVLEGEGRSKVLIIDISGFISEKERAGNQLMKETPSTVTEVKEALQKAEQDKDIAGIVLRINSPGGTVTASDIIYHEIIRFKERQKIPVYACITGIGTSGGYYVASAADQIFAHPTAITGSIGVLLMKFNVEGLLAKVGVTEKTIKSGEKKDIMSPFRAATMEEEKLLQNIVTTLYGRFLEVILLRPGNQLNKDELVTVADGRIYTASQALEVKLIDRVGYLEESYDAIKKTRGVEEAKIITYYRPGSYKGSIYSGSPLDTFSFLQLFGFNNAAFEELTGPQFMYVWQP